MEWVWKFEGEKEGSHKYLLSLFGRLDPKPDWSNINSLKRKKQKAKLHGRFYRGIGVWLTSWRGGNNT